MLIWGMRIVYALLMLVIAGCGSGTGGGGEPPPLPPPVINGVGSAVWNAITPGWITISCADVNPVWGEPCDGELVSERKKLNSVTWDGGIYNSGTLLTYDWAYNQLTIANGFPDTRRVCVVWKYRACPSHPAMASEPSFDIPPMTAYKHWNMIGANFDICAVPGSAWTQVEVHDGSNKALGEQCDMVELAIANIVWMFE